jgi:hypothetical protein
MTYSFHIRASGSCALTTLNHLLSGDVQVKLKKLMQPKAYLDFILIFPLLKFKTKSFLFYLLQSIYTCVNNIKRARPWLA